MADMTAPGWTIAEACAEFEAAGMPVSEFRFRAAVRAFQLRPVGTTPSGPSGGRGHPLFDIGQLQRLHSWMTELRPPA